MASRLPPGEAARRAAERKRATFSGEKYKTYDTSEGFGNYAEWAAQAAAFLNGDTVLFFNEFETDSTTTKKKSTNPDFDILGLDDMPFDLSGLKSAYRRAALAAFKAAGSNDTAAAYVNAFRQITLAFEKLKRQRGWK